MSLKPEEILQFEKLVEGNLEHFPVYVTYKKFDEETNEDNYSDYFSEARKLKDTYPSSDIFCNKLSRNLKKFSSIAQAGKNKQESCTCLNFWLYDNINKIFTEYKDIRSTGIIDRFINGWMNINMGLTGNTCSIKDDGVTSIEELKYYKYLHDYFRNYDHIIENYNKENTCLLYKKYVSYINKFYEPYKRKCCDYNEEDCYFLLKFECGDKYNPSNVLTKITCDAFEKSHSLQEAGGASLSGDQSDPNIKRVVNVPQGGDTESFTSPAHTTMSIIFPLIIIPITLFLLNKFTPIGHFLHTKLPRKDKLPYSLNEETMQDLVTNDSNYVDNNSINASYITYHPL
ncbi:PIR Superfamily Protein [Plasmodium ovale wallikeri]|uniref:PIR Superfamily Protein n=1 Tax=Plasmodium ovale wallikeri TaxID=864142 RepID=A0A1A9A8X3_PLAOA|nr:PIR Superfamily Protein [Plasmodium ovale wallikeri]SBT57964.1 PIR Superfamily Protein [Plasmodium ovale wallikeri]